MNFLIVDNETLAREDLGRAISALLPSFQSMETDNLISAREAILKGTIDGVFLDPSVPCGQGMNFVAELRTMEIPVVVTSRIGDYAVAAFDSDATDYLMKPIEPSRLMRAISKIRKHSRKAGEGMVVFSDQNHCWPVPLKDVVMAEGEGSYVTIHSLNRKPILVCRSLKEIEVLLGEKDYIRVNRSQIIRLQSVISIKRRDSKGFAAEVDACGTVTFSRRQAQAFRQRFGI